MLALASSALSLPAQQQKLAIAPDNSTAPLPELNLLTHFRAWTCGERMYRLAPKDAGCPKFTAPLMDKGACDQAVCSAMAPGKEMNPYNVDKKEGAGAGKYHVRALRPLAAPPRRAPSPLPRRPPTPAAPAPPDRRGRSASTTTSGRRAATARPTRPTSRTRSTAPTRRW